MKIQYTLETLAEVKAAISNVRQEGDTSPPLVGTLEVRASYPDGHTVELIGDPNYRFTMTFKDFVMSACESAGLKLLAADNIPE